MKLLLIDSDWKAMKPRLDSLSLPDFRWFYAATGDEALDILAQESIDFVLVEGFINEGAWIYGDRLVAEIHKQHPELPACMFSADLGMSLRGVSRGANAIYNKENLSVDPASLEQLIRSYAQ